MKDHIKSKYNKVLEKYHNIHKKQTGIIYACGPSLNKFDISKLDIDPTTTIHIAMKIAILSKNIPHIDYYFFGDNNDKSQLYEDRLKGSPFTKFGLVITDGEEHRLCYSRAFCKQCKAHPIEVSYKAGFQSDISLYPCYKSTTLFPCLQFSLYSGLSTIYVVGLDATQDNSFLDIEFKPRKANLKQKMDDHMGKFQAYKNQYYSNRKIIHVNPVNVKAFDESVFI
jgi:hypothetical protein